MEYIDGYILAVKNDKKQEYIDFAKRMVPAFKKHGALNVVETWGTDVPEGKVTSFSMAVKREEDESVVFSWVTWPDKATRDAAWPALEADEEMAHLFETMPFDGKRIIFGGFETIVNE